MLVFRKCLSQATLNWILTALALAALLPSLLLPMTAQAELRAFRLKITNPATGTERQVVTRFDNIQYPMYAYVSPKETITIDQTWMCYARNDYVGTLCAAPAQGPATSLTKPSPATSTGPASGSASSSTLGSAAPAPGLATPPSGASGQDRSPASVVPPKR
jgi:hypothetical protein